MQKIVIFLYLGREKEKEHKMSTKAFKQEKIDAYKSNLEKATVAVVTNYTGLTVEEITNLRRELQKNDADYTVTKNTLAKIAIKGTKFEALEEVLKGSTAIAFGFSDQVAPAKILKKFIQDTDKCEMLAAVLDGKLLNAKETEALASLPSKEEIYAKMLGCVNSPATGVVGSINAVMSSLVRAIDAVRQQKSA